MSAHDYLKELKPTGQFVFNYDKIQKLNFPLYLLISMRGDNGKTFGAKEFAREHFEKTGEKSKWLLNTAVQVEEEKFKWLEKNQNAYPKKWKDYFREGTRIYKKVGGKKIEFLEMVALSAAEKKKGSRENIAYVFYDEFNVGVERIGVRQTTLFNNLLATYKPYDTKINTLRVFIFGNNKSLNSNLLIDLKIWELKSDFIQVNGPSGKKLMLILSPVMPENYIIKRTEHDWLYDLATMTGEADHIYRNKNLYNEMAGIMDFDNYLMKDHGAEPLANYKISGRLYVMFTFKLNGITNYGFGTLEKKIPDIDTIALRLIDMDHDYKFNSRTPSNIRYNLSHGILWFDSIASKVEILKCLK